MVPKLIHPLPPAAHSPGSPGGGGDGGDGLGGEGSGGGGGLPPGPGPISTGALDTWMQSVNEERPPTPPRGRATNGSPSLAFFE
jgi:protein phosphatase